MPHNIAFPLQSRKIPQAERERRVREIAKRLGIEAFLDRKPTQLSGGQQQRVAMGRAIIRQPSVFLSTSRSRTSTPSSASRCDRDRDLQERLG